MSKISKRHLEDNFQNSLLLKTSQNLTDEEIEQVRQNLKFASQEYVDQKIAEIDINIPTEYESIILKSSVLNSAKKFRLTIDDDGVLSAEEVML